MEVKQEFDIIIKEEIIPDYPCPILTAEQDATENWKSTEKQCNKCDFKTANTDYLKMHETKCNVCEYFCELCSYSSKNRGHLKRHMKRHSTRKPFACEQCDYTSLSKAILQQHLKVHNIKDHHNKKLIHCKFCSYTTEHNYQMNRHVPVHTGEKPHHCELCDFKTSRKDNLKVHRSLHAKKKLNRRKSCDFSTANNKSRDYKTIGKHNLRKHLSVPTNKKFHRCKQCNYRTADINDFKQHSTVHTGKKLLGCKRCEYKTESISILNRHILVHNGGPVRCRKCEKSFKDKYFLKIHQKIHTAQCHVPEKTGEDNKKIVRKDRVVFNKKFHWCKQCNYKTADINDFKQHSTVHTGKKLFSCKQCEYKTPIANHLDRHLFVHTGGPVSCPVCEKSFKDNYFFKLHRKVHTKKDFECAKRPAKTNIQSHVSEKKRRSQLNGEDDIKKFHQCKQCNYKTTQINDFKQHSTVHAGKKLFSCKHCEYKTPIAKHLDQHLLVHGGGPVRCSVCEKSFQDNYFFKLHRKVHTRKDFKCAYDAPAKTNIRSHVSEKRRRSRLNGEDLLDHQCKKCDYKTADINDFKQHSTVHNKLFGCKHCEYKTPISNHLDRHLLVHGGGPVRCSVCENSFKDKYLFKLHRKKKDFKCIKHPAKTNIPEIKQRSQLNDEDDDKKVLLDLKIVAKEHHQCKQCNYKTAHINDLKQHSTVHTGKKLFSCKHCEYKTPITTHLDRHLLVHAGGPVRCSICENTFKDNYFFKLHRKKEDFKCIKRPAKTNIPEIKQGSQLNDEDDDKKVLLDLEIVPKEHHQCKQCNYKTAHINDFKQHSTVHTGKKLFSCKHCEYKTVITTHLDRHLLVHTGGPVRCSICENIFKDNYFFKLHRKKEDFKCIKRPAKTNIPEIKQRSQLNDEDDDKKVLLDLEIVPKEHHQCKQCNYKTAHINDFKQHSTVHTDKKLFSCKHCEYKTVITTHLDRHLLVHTGGPVRCPVCDKSLKDNYFFKLHRKVHTKEDFKCAKRPYETDIVEHVPAKKQRFQLNGDNKILLDLEIVPKVFHQCKQCNYKTPDANDFKQHSTVHTGKKLFSCKHCEYKTPNAKHLKRHAQVHSGGPVRCPICETSCKDNYFLKLHRKIHTDAKRSQLNGKDDKRVLLALEIEPEEHIVLNQKVHHCKQCNYKTADINRFKQHSTVHTGKKLLNCEECEFKTAIIAHLNRHAQVHNGGPVRCPICEKSCKDNYFLKLHRKIHTDTKEVFKCATCPYEATTKTNIRRHVVQHVSEKKRSENFFLDLEIVPKEYIVFNSLDFLFEEEPNDSVS